MAVHVISHPRSFAFSFQLQYWHPQGQSGCQEIYGIDREKNRMRPRSRELHELPYTKMDKSETISLTSRVTVPLG